MDDPHLIERETIADRLQPPLHRERPLARVQMMPWLLFIAMLAIAAWLAWRAFGPEDNGDPLATSLVAFEKQNTLTVFTAQLSPVVSSEESRLFDRLLLREAGVLAGQAVLRVAAYPDAFAQVLRASFVEIGPADPERRKLHVQRACALVPAQPAAVHLR